MTIENEGASAPANDTAQVSQTPETDTNVTQTDDTDAPEFDDNGDPVVKPVVDDTEELDYEGLKVRVPKAIKAAVMRHVDYTRKTQELAESRKAFEAAQASSVTAHKDYVEALADAKVYDKQLQQYANVDWATFEQTDPSSAASHWRAFTQLKEAKEAAEQKAVTTKQRIESEAQRTSTEARVKQVEKLETTLKEHIPDFTPEIDAKIMQSGIARGYSRQEIIEAALQNPQVYVALNEARLWREHQAKQATEKRITAQQAVQPAVEVGAKAPATKDPTRMSTAEWMRWRSQQLKKKA